MNDHTSPQAAGTNFDSSFDGTRPRITAVGIASAFVNWIWQGIRLTG
jgi:hypothetical protein